MNKAIRLILILSTALCSFHVSAQYYDTLPKGVRMFFTRHIETNVKSSFNHSKSESPFSYQLKTDIKSLESIDNEALQDTLKFLSGYPEAYAKINLGTHQIKASADVKVDAYALAYGITNRITAYVAIPIYKANVNIKYQKVSGDTNKEVAEILQTHINDDLAQAVGDTLEKVSGPNGSTLQNGIVNGFGYDELGNWKGDGLGDTEFGIMYQTHRNKKHGSMLTLGGVAPTGYIDDPDIIQDIGFGDGQWDAFIEFGGGYIVSDSFTLNSWVRYTHQFATEKTLRVPISKDISFSDEKADFTEKLGNKLHFGASADISLNDWFSLHPHLLFNRTAKAEYSSSNSAANRNLANNTESSSQQVKLLAKFSTVKLFQQKKFILPAQISASYIETVSGQNTPKADRFEVELRMFF